MIGRFNDGIQMQINEFLPPIGTDLLLSSSLQIEYPVWGQNVNM